MIRLMITSAGAKAPLIRAAREAMARRGEGGEVLAADLDPEAPARYVADAFWAAPRFETLKTPDLVEALRARDVRVVLPTRDGELRFWASAREPLAAAGVGVIISEPEAIALTGDKLEFAQRLGALGMDAIPAFSEPSPEQAELWAVKERFGAGSRGVGLGLTRIEALEHAKTLVSPIFQPMITGVEISIDAFALGDQDPHGLVLRRRDQVVGGESRITTTFSHGPYEAAAAAAIRALRLFGPVVLQAFITPDGALRFIECNPRFGGASTASIPVGLDLLGWSLEAGLGQTPLAPFRRAPFEVRQVRTACDQVIRDPDL
jgi:carbamoyl-phosphate synthase large subunit